MATCARQACGKPVTTEPAYCSTECQTLDRVQRDPNGASLTDQELLDTLRKVKALLGTLDLDPEKELHREVSEWLFDQRDSPNACDDRLQGAIEECEAVTGDYQSDVWANRADR